MPLIAMLLAPARSVGPDVRFLAFLEGRQHRLGLDRFRLFACVSSFLDDVDTLAVGVFAGLVLALYVKRFQPSSHCSPAKRPPNPRSKATVSGPIRENTGELRSTVFWPKSLILLWSSNDCEQRRTIYWRKGWDSNPRYPCGHAGFQDRCLKPLGHPSSAGRSGT